MPPEEKLINVDTGSTHKVSVNDDVNNLEYIEAIQEQVCLTSY